jgi:hypothetical protein
MGRYAHPHGKGIFIQLLRAGNSWGILTCYRSRDHAGGCRVSASSGRRSGVGMQGSFWLKCAAAAILGLAATRATVARDVTPDEWWATRGPGPAAQSSSDDWWSAMDATLPPDVAVKKAAKARKRAPPPDTYPPPPSDWRPPPVPPPIPQWTGEFGGRYWFSLGSTELDLHGGDSFTPLVSRLTYTNIQAHSGEAFGRVEHLSGFFVKGFAGGGAITTGNLQDEDFPPFDPGGIYSSTNSDQRNGRLAYATIDTGWTWRGDTSKLGFFVGSVNSANSDLRITG